MLKVSTMLVRRAGQNRLPIFASVYLTLLFGAFYIFFASADAESFKKAGDSVQYQAIWGCLYAVLAVKLLQRRLIGKLITKGGVFLLLIASVLTAYALKPPSEFTPVLRFLLYIFTAAFGLWLSGTYTPEKLFHTIYQLSIGILIAHWVLFPFVPNIQWDQLERTTVFGTNYYGGIFGHKNLAGAFFGFAATVALSRAMLLPFGKRKLRSLFVFALHVVTVLASGAAGPIIALMATGPVLVGMRKHAWGSRFVVFYWVGIIVLGIVGALLADTVLELLGRDTSLTGRAVLLALWPTYYLERPLLGYGFSGFQFAGPIPGVPDIASQVTTFVGFDQSHLEMLLQFGAIGTALFLIILVRALRFAFRLVKASGGVYALAPMGGFVYITVTSFNESYLILQNHFYTALIFWAYFSFQSARSKRLARAMPIPGTQATPADPRGDLTGQDNWRQPQRS